MDISRKTGGTCLLLALGSCGPEADAPVGPQVPETVISSIAVSSRLPSGSMMQSDRTMGVLGVEVQVGAAASSADGSIVYHSTPDHDRFTWKSSAPDVATVRETSCMFPDPRPCYVVTSIGEGTATITATSDGVSGSIDVRVVDRAQLAWSERIPGGIEVGNVMGPDGNIYVGNDDFSEGRTLWYAVSPQEGVRWTLDLPLTFNSIPAIGQDGTLYIGSRTGSGDAGFTGRLIAVDPGGTVRWMLEDTDGIRSSPAIGPDGTIYVAGGHHVYAVAPQGEILWNYRNEGRVFFVSSPGISSDGTIYVGGEDDRLYAIDPDGSLRWTFEVGDRIRSSPSIGTDGTVYFGAHDGRLYAVHPDGSERWSVELDLPGRGLKSSPSIGPDGTIYVTGLEVTAVDPAGSILWTYPASAGGATPVLGADGTVYVANYGIYALDQSGNLLWDYKAEQPAGGSPIVGPDGTIIVAAGSELVAISERGSANGGFDGSPWPQIRGDRANTGQAGG